MKYIPEKRVWQWDQGVRLIVPEEYVNIVTQFYSKSYPDGLAIDEYEVEDGITYCPIPNQMLINAEHITVYAYSLEEEKCVTKSMTQINVSARPRPAQYTLKPTDTITYEKVAQLIADLKQAKLDEADRTEAELIRVQYEAQRKTAEEGRENAESSRATAEQDRASAESSRETAEKGRASAETERVNAESERASAEQARVEAETSRENAESSRATAEQARANAESERASAEQARITAETERANAESDRASAEQLRAAAETERAGFYEGFNSELNSLKGDLADLTKAEIIQPTIFANTGCSGRGIYKHNNQTSKMFNVEKGAKYFIATNNITNGGFSKTQYTSEYEESGLALTNISPINRTYYEATDNGYLYVSATNLNVTCYKIDTTVDEVKNDVTKLKAIDSFHFLDKFELVWEQGKCVNSLNGEVLSASIYYHATNPYEVLGGLNLIVFTRSTNDYSGLAFYDKDNNYISGQKTYDVEWKEWKVPIPINAKYVRLTAYTYNPAVDISVAYARYENVHEDIYSIYKKTSELEDKTKNVLTYDCFPFERIGVVGDSLASGCSNYYNESGQLKGIDIPKYSWGKFLSRTYGISVDLYSQGGANTRTWLSSDFGLQRLQASEPCEMYYIGLGNNDYFSLGESYLGTISDVTVGNESSNADTYYGNYSRIIAELKSKSPRCKIFCFTEPNIGNRELSHLYNLAIKEVAGLYDNVFVLDLENDTFYSSKPISDTRVGSHYTPVGYKMMSEYIYKITCEFIISHVENFIDTQWIIENHN